MVHFCNLSKSKLSKSDSKWAKLVFVAKFDGSTPVVSFKSAFVAQLDQSNSAFTFASKDLGFRKYSLIYSMSLLFIQLWNDLLYLSI